MCVVEHCDTCIVIWLFSPFNASIHSQIPESALDLMDHLLTLDPSRRMTASEALQHPFLSGFDRDSVPPPV